MSEIADELAIWLSSAHEYERRTIKAEEWSRMKTQPSEETVGKLFVDRDGRVYTHIAYARNPTATFQALGYEVSPPRLSGVVGSPILEGLTLLVPEDEGE